MPPLWLALAVRRTGFVVRTTTCGGRALTGGVRPVLERDQLMPTPYPSRGSVFACDRSQFPQGERRQLFEDLRSSTRTRGEGAIAVQHTDATRLPYPASNSTLERQKQARQVGAATNFGWFQAWPVPLYR